MPRVVPTEPADEAAEIGPGTLISGSYRLVRAIGQGGMGSVWEASHVRLDARVALKFMAPALLDQSAALTRFRREARAAATLVSPYIVRVSDYGVHATPKHEVPYIVMELLDGEDLHQRLKRGPLALGEVAVLVRQACDGLGVAHAAGIIHRDLKPRNLFLAKAGKDTLLKILDFGCAKDLAALEARDRTETGLLLGSVHHMSPEQARGQAIGIDTDLWALGVVAYESLLGRLPFVGSHIGDVLVRIATDPAPAPTSLDPAWPRDLDRFFERALAKDRSLRFARAEDMATELERIAREAPGLSRQADLEPAQPAPPAVSGTFGRSAPTESGADPPTRRVGDSPPPETATEPLPSPAPSAERAQKVDAARPPGRRVLPWISLVMVLVAGMAMVAGSREGSPARADAVIAEPAEPPAAAVEAATVAAEPPPPIAPTPAAAPAAPSAAAARSAVPASARPRPSAAAPRARASATPAATQTAPKYDPFTGIPVP